jgi:hypothetical protein
VAGSFAPLLHGGTVWAKVVPASARRASRNVGWDFIGIAFPGYSVM